MATKKNALALQRELEAHEKGRKNNLLVKYGHIMNEISLKDLTPRELNLFMLLMAKAKNEGLNEIKIPVDDFIKTLDPEGQYLTSQLKVKQAIASTYHKTDKLYTIDNEEEFAIFHLMNYAEYRYETQAVTYQINKKFLQILNDFGKDNPFTAFELRRFLQLESKHSKNLYRQLMQWKVAGEMSIDISDFRFRMGLSESYTPKNIMAKVIKPAIEELLEKKYFAELKCEPNVGWGRGSKITGYTFYFKECVNDQLPGQISMFEDESGKKQFRTITDKSKPAKTNKFNNFESREVKFDENGYPI